ncbi:LamG-like jellyroll fold domain-containing protein [Dyadobacter crusticola]|uniref:LamG-like jellyroll fold domain-containing protein n=1 Tax=Dyadobacter crusticola TaxID=292407 RepID=UPI0004E103C5|nr:LamG-like jellyroll fold domain-containing protein [Dyadobacter crusticola]
MSATIITSPGTLAVPNGVKVKTDVLDYPQTVLLVDFRKSKTYPPQTNPVPNGYEFVNLAKSGPAPNECLVAERSAIPFSAANKSLSFQSIVNAGSSAPADRLIYGSATAPYPTIGIEGQTTDVLVTMWVKISSVRQSGTVLTLSSTDPATGNAKNNLNFQYGFVAGEMNIFFAGVDVTQAGALSFEYNKWVHIAMYGRNEGYNGKTRLAKVYRNGVPVVTRTTNFPASMLASNNTVPLTIGDGWDGELGRLAIMKGLDVAGLNPDTIVAQEYAANSPHRPNA